MDTGNRWLRFISTRIAWTVKQGARVCKNKFDKECNPYIDILY